MNRYRARENAFIAGFELSFRPDELEDILALSRLEDSEYQVDEFGEGLLRNYLNNASDVDKLIKANLKGWQMERIPRVCLVILRLSAAELFYGAENDLTGVIINNAVELAKKFANNDDYQFVNGVLATLSHITNIQKALDDIKEDANTEQQQDSAENI